MPQVAHGAHQILQEFRPVPAAFTNGEVMCKRGDYQVEAQGHTAAKEVSQPDIRQAASTAVSLVV